MPRTRRSSATRAELPALLDPVGVLLSPALSHDDAKQPLTGGLPLARLLPGGPRSSSYYVITTIDQRGRLADRSPLRVLRRPPDHRVTVSVATYVAVVARAGGSSAVTRQGHLRFPAAIRHACRLTAGDRLLVAAHPDRDVLLAYTMRFVDQMVLGYHAKLHGARR